MVQDQVIEKVIGRMKSNQISFVKMMMTQFAAFAF